MVAISAANPPVTGASCETISRPVLLTDCGGAGVCWLNEGKDRRNEGKRWWNRGRVLAIWLVLTPSPPPRRPTA